jgi:predicted DNA binding CopG/RHH family protein
MTTMPLPDPGIDNLDAWITEQTGEVAESQKNWQRALVASRAEAVGNADTTRRLHIEVSNDLARLLSEAAADRGLPRITYMRALLAYALACDTGRDPADLYAMMPPIAPWVKR